MNTYRDLPDIVDEFRTRKFLESRTSEEPAMRLIRLHLTLPQMATTKASQILPPPYCTITRKQFPKIRIRTSHTSL